MVRLKIELFRYGCLVAGKILEQDKSLRHGNLLWKSSSGTMMTFSFFISNAPQLSHSAFYLGGRDVKGDGTEFYCRFNSELGAEQCIAHIRDGVVALNAVGEKKTPLAIIELEHIE